MKRMHLPVDQLEDSHVEDLHVEDLHVGDSDETVVPVAVEPQSPDGRVAGRASGRRSEALRWVISFMVVAACHGAGALALLRNVTQAPDSGIDTPVVMLDLPEALVPSVAPVQDLPPGPVMEDEVPPAPQPKEETKPPEPEAEVALPKPDPPKQEQPPAELVERTAPVAARTPPPSIARWQGQLAAHIQRFRRYPAAARARGESGVATVSFTIDREGRLVRSSIVKSSGSPALDQETLAALTRAMPMPRPPDQATDAELIMTLPMEFNLR
jgi:protein TonB